MLRGRVATAEPELTAVSGGLVWPQDGWPGGCGHLAGGPGPRTDSLVPLASPGAEPNLAVRPSLESLLAASSHMLKEVLDSPFSDPLKNLRLPRELSSNKKYSWMQKKEERVRPQDLYFSCGPERPRLLGGSPAGHPSPVAHSAPVPPLMASVFLHCVRHVPWAPCDALEWKPTGGEAGLPFVACVVLGSCRPLQVQTCK